MWEGGEEKREKRKTIAARKEIQQCQAEATMTGKIELLAAGFPMTQRRREKHSFEEHRPWKGGCKEGASLGCCRQQITPICALHSVQPSKSCTTQNPVSSLSCWQACVCHSKPLQTSKPHNWAAFCPRFRDVFSTGSTLIPFPLIW